MDGPTSSIGLNSTKHDHDCWFFITKAYNGAESDVGGLSRRAQLIEEEVERSEERLAKAVTELCVQFHRADSAIKKRQQLENLNRLFRMTNMQL